MNKSMNHEEYVLQLRLNHGDDVINKAVRFLEARVGWTTSREQARFLAYVFEYLPEDTKDRNIYNISVRSVRSHLELPLTYDDLT